MGGFARIANNEIIVLVNDAEKGSDIDPQEAQQTLKIAQANLRKAEGKSCIFVTNRSMEEIRLPALEMKTNNKIKMEYLQVFIISGSCFPYMKQLCLFFSAWLD
ncbi:ATP synthase epsilon chain [Forsythia ovata]|uniref:ATP synthase epsilon chain n=1 Tax=Forsythia ovata TaxID=205694 RepID=A0ABD1USU5_9LAMI